MKKLLQLFILILLFSSCSSHGTKLEFGKGELYYTDKVTAVEAQKTGDFLKELGYLSDDRQTSFQLDKEDEVYKIRMVVKDEFLEGDTSLDYSFMAMGALASIQVFDGNTVHVDLCNDKLEVKRTVKSE